MLRVLLFTTQLAAAAAPALGAEGAGEGAIVVLAAASMTDVLPAVAKAWSELGHPEVRFSFDATSRLARQIEAGIPADLFVSADLEWMDFLSRQGLIRDGARVDLAGNSLVAIVPSISTLSVRGPPDLVGPAVKRLALGFESVPAGKYGRAALARAGVWQELSARVVTGANVRSVLAWVARGEAEAGVVYATDAHSEPRVRIAFVFAADSHPPIVYSAAVLRDSSRRGRLLTSLLLHEP